jgi:hypothetical protein
MLHQRDTHHNETANGSSHRVVTELDAERVTALVRAIDDLLFALEDLNLQGIDRVPAPLRHRASKILHVVPDPDEQIRVRYKVAPLIDVLFRAQELLFQLRDPGRIAEAEEWDTA